jgi:hypothetical protein
VPKHIPDLRGRRYGRLRVIARAKDDTTGRTKWLCECICGGRPAPVRARDLLSGHTKSCGCFRRDALSKAMFRHGHRTNRSSEYNSWAGLNQRCNYPRHVSWKNYGGRGLKVEFACFTDFLADVGPKPSPRHSIDRIDVNAGYKPGNLRWATAREQRLNQRRSRAA